MRHRYVFIGPLGVLHSRSGCVIISKNDEVMKLTGEKFVELCFREKEDMLSDYFSSDSQTAVASIINELAANGVDKAALHELVNSVLNESFYTLLLALDGETSLSGEQICYKLFDEEDNLLNECGEIEEAAYRFFMEEDES